MSAILLLPEFAAWRKNGGLIVSDALGVPAVAKYFDPSEKSFPHRQVAKEALMAGNDLLPLIDHVGELKVTLYGLCPACSEKGAG